MQISKMRTEEEDKYSKKNREEQVISCAKTYNISQSKSKRNAYSMHWSQIKVLRITVISLDLNVNFK